MKKNNQESEKTQRVAQRRLLIFRQVVLDNRPLKFSDLAEQTDLQYTTTNAETDRVAFAEIGCNLRIRGTAKKKDQEFYHAEGLHTDYDSARESINENPKKLVAGLAASIICGYRQPDLIPAVPEWLRSNEASKLINRLQRARPSEITVDDARLEAAIKSVLTRLHDIVGRDQRGKPFGTVTADMVLARLRDADITQGVKTAKVLESLKNFWEEKHRLIAIDSGTTNIVLSQCLRQLSLPVPGSNLCSLTVCTNSRRIFEELGPSNVPIKTIIIGGQQKYRSPTVAGAMAEMFLRTVTFLQFGICFLGATKVDLDRLAVCSDSQEEASIKTLLLERSSLRVIIVDDSKLQVGPGREGYRFASIDPQHIDLVITNCPLTKRAKDNTGGMVVAAERFAERVAAIRACGVPVLVASSPGETLDWPENDE